MLEADQVMMGRMAGQGVGQRRLQVPAAGVGGAGGTVLTRSMLMIQDILADKQRVDDVMPHLPVSQ